MRDRGMLQRTSNDNRRWIRALLLAILPVVATSILGQLATYPNIESWYATLAKPIFNPPNWVFAPVWTTLYVLMAYAAWRLLSMPASTPGRSTALILFFIQLALNALWSWMFFAMQSPVAGLVNIIVQIGFILATIAQTWRVEKTAALCLVPLAVWVSFAAVLNFAVWYLN
ncbi:TspO/MBR family protein [Sinorhizobium sp. GL28]|uniref:TspO/MBR family protein n=1 Tax=Sinorhizobium sp. GL28 TaxID=1358418 RepID=UPI00278C2EF5|nr:TspO/MBR family protein [Sinorhizobium sp. GL28]